MKSSLISSEEAVTLVKKPNVKFIDGSWHLDKNRNAVAEYNAERIPGALRFDIEEIADKSTGLPYMLPTVEQFCAAMDNFGITNKDQVVVYVTKNCFTAPRVWWTFKVFDHENVQVLDGGLEAWKQAGGPTDTSPPAAPVRSTGYRVNKFHSDYVVNSQQVLNAVQTGSYQIADARGLARFAGEIAEPRAGLRSGHIPESICLPFTSITVPGDCTKYKDMKKVREFYEKNGLMFGSKIINTCGGGVTACINALALYELGQKDLATVPVYDGSWNEWGGREDLPIAKNKPEIIEV